MVVAEPDVGSEEPPKSTLRSRLPATMVSSLVATASMPRAGRSGHWQHVVTDEPDILRLGAQGAELVSLLREAPCFRRPASLTEVAP